MRLCFRACEYDKNSNFVECVAKVFKPELDAADHEYYDEAMTQMIAESHAQEFNRRSRTHKVALLPCNVLQIQDGRLGGSRLCALEPYLPGDYVKHNDNAGAVETNEAVPQAFSHFTYENSNRLLVVCDIQGVGNFYTDPQIHSFDGEGFGSGNLGLDGLNRFLNSHACTSVCEELRLPPLRPGETDEQMARRLQAEESKPPPSQAATSHLEDGYSSSSSSDSSWICMRRNAGSKNLEEAMRILRFQ